MEMELRVDMASPDINPNLTQPSKGPTIADGEVTLWLGRVVSPPPSLIARIRNAIAFIYG